MSESTQHAVASGGAYEVLKSRLNQQGSHLKSLSSTFNQQRQTVFGGQELALIGKANVQTQARCVPVDMAQVNRQLLFGYEVKVGIKAVPSLDDVFGLYQLHDNDGVYRVEPVALEKSFLADERFMHEFTELFTYYRDARLSQIARQENILYIAFQIGMRAEDRKVFRFQLNAHSVEYLDALGDQILIGAEQHDFEWVETTRADHVLGEHPHVSIKDKLFVECVGGDLTIKLEDNTEHGLGIYAEPVDDAHQSVADADIAYAFIGDLIALKIRPNREKQDRYFIFNPLNQQVQRTDAIGHCAKALPDDHGLLFSHGYVLANGESKSFDLAWKNLRFFHQMSSPNGEDVLYFFFDMERGHYVIYTYNMIEKAVSAPLESHGFSIYPDGQMLLFEVSENAEASTIHPLRIWQTPFSTSEHYVEQHGKGDRASPLFNLGNAELVKALSSVLTICHLSQSEEVTQAAFETLLKQCQTTLDHYHWLKHDYALGLATAIEELMATVDKIIDEFAKVLQLQQHAKAAFEQEQEAVQALISRVKLAPKEQANVLLGLLSEVKNQVGTSMALLQQHYMDKAAVEALLAKLSTQREELNVVLLQLLQDEKAYQPFKAAILSIDEQLAEVEKTAEISELQQQVEQLRTELALVSEEVADIETDDPTQATKILDLTTEVSSMLNATSAKLRAQVNQLQGEEAQAEFSAQFKLLAQSVSGAMEQATTPDQCDNQLAKLIGQLEKLESRFADFDQFLAEIYAKRDEIQSTLENHKQQLVSAQQRRIENMLQAANVTFSSIEKRVSRFDEVAALNSYFATDAMVLKLRQLSGNIRDLDDSVKADSIDARLKALQDQSLRALRDNQDIFEQGGKVLRLGQHKFSVNQQGLDLSLVEHQSQLCLHISGTDFYQQVHEPEFLALQASAKLDLISESEQIYRGEYLAYLVLQAARQGEADLDLSQLEQARKDQQLLPLIQRFAAPRYKEGYVKGIHDHDALQILNKLLPLYTQAGLLRFAQTVRAQGLLWVLQQSSEQITTWRQHAHNAWLLKQHLHSQTAYHELQRQLASTLPQVDGVSSLAISDYVLQLLAAPAMSVEVSRDAMELCDSYLQFRRTLGWQGNTLGAVDSYQDHLQWLTAYGQQHPESAAFTVEAAITAVWREQTDAPLMPVAFSLAENIEGLLGEHGRVTKGGLSLVLDEFLQRAEHHHSQVVPQFESYLAQRSQLLERAKAEFRLSELKPRPLTSFVRNKLISESYLPLIGTNFAKQMGALGDNKRTDLMGMLLLISPPGYGKTTLIEYVAHKLGLVFMKINGPSIGHQVTSLDPADAPDQNAAREITKINLAFEMGNNVLLYLDDIQHTHPEFLQKFISLCDGTRRIEGTWQGQPKTYDMRGKKFAVVMAGNPYTESGETFRIPDMLANRADIYNLGDMLSDQKAAFELSFIENCLTANSVLAPLATRDLNDLYRFVAMAQDQGGALSDMSHAYSSTEAAEITSTLAKLIQVQQTVLRVNQAYIASAATADQYRTEPPFKLQGSYRNMNKLAEKISSVMTDTELQTVLQDHYQGEAQTLASGTEENLLKLAQLSGEMGTEQAQRWQEIVEGYQRNQALGDSDDRAGQVVQQLVALNQHFASVTTALNPHKESMDG